jgi:hypothetical protein
LDHSSRGTETSPGRHPSTPSWVHDLLHWLACLGSICSPLSRFFMIVAAVVQSFAATGYNTWLLSHAFISSAGHCYSLSFLSLLASNLLPILYQLIEASPTINQLQANSTMHICICDKQAIVHTQESFLPCKHKDDIMVRSYPTQIISAQASLWDSPRTVASSCAHDWCLSRPPSVDAAGENLSIHPFIRLSIISNAMHAYVYTTKGHHQFLFPTFFYCLEPVWHSSASPVELFFRKQLHKQLHERGREPWFCSFTMCLTLWEWVFKEADQRVRQRVGCLAIEVVKLLVKLLMKLYQTGP